MNCEVRRIGQRRDQWIRYSLLLEDKLVIVENVPASVCDHCRETALTPDLIERLQQLVWQSHPPAKVLETPVYEYA